MARRSLWAQYRAEVSDSVYLEEEYGFIAYSLLPDAVLIEELYVVPEQRRTGLGLSLFCRVEELARTAGKSASLACVRLDSRAAAESLKTHLNVGFSPISAENGIIWLRCPLYAEGV